MTQIQQQFLSYLPPTLRNLMEGGSKRELLNKVDATLLAFDGKLVHIESGKIAEFQDSSAAMIDPDQLAQAC
ncbi:MAG: hypothetical protein QGG54_09365, partial [Gammaproteobacteria bacterium]|nr:hypothetical protein [Gammaproteobacteria bacterium]